jgi:ribosomal protein S17E
MAVKSFGEFLSESYVNALIDDVETKKKYTNQVWDILQSSYKKIGGVKGNGFKSPEDMLNIPFWKMNVVNGKVVAVIMYKDKGGRKSVAMGTDGSDLGAAKAGDMLGNELERSYGEKSKAALGKMLKSYPEDIIKTFMVNPSDVSKMLKGVEVNPVKGMQTSDIPKDGQETLKRYPFVIEYAYLREIGGDMTFKVMLGTRGKTIR